MKRVYLITTAIAIVISTSIIGSYHFFIQKDPVISYTTTAPASAKMLYTKNIEGEVVPIDFTATAEKVLDAVVHISSVKSSDEAETYSYRYRELPDPFRDFFKDSPFYEFFDQPGQDSKKWRRSPMPMMGSGSGVIINDQGYIITNNHVIENADEIEVTLHNNGTYKATVVGTDPTTDLALLQIKADNLKALSLVNSDDVEIGEWVLAIGNPFSLNSTVTAGIVSAKARNININKEKFAVESFIQTDAAINPGNSGGALVNLNGDLIGINTAIASRTGTYNGYGFAVPSNIVSKVVEDLLKYGNVQRAVLGVTIRTMDGRLAKEKNIDFTSGVYIESVNEDSAADKAGLKPGDIVLKVDGEEVSSSPRLQEIIARHRPGDRISVLVQRDGREKEIMVQLKNRIGSEEIRQKEHLEILNQLGADVETLKSEELKRLDISGGVRITQLYPGKLRMETQIQEGFIITHVNGQSVRDVKEFVEIVEAKKGGIMLEGIYEDRPGKYYYAFGLNP